VSQASAAQYAPAEVGQSELRTLAGRSLTQLAWRRLRRNWLAMAALVVLLALCLVAIAAPWITTNILHHSPIKGRLTERFQPPSSSHLFGTDDLGRDTFARLIYAGRVSLAIGFMVALISCTIGVSFGLLAGYYGGWLDDVINALIQLVLNIPTLFLFILLAVLFRPSVVGLAFIFGATSWPGTARQVRGRVLSERGRDYVDAAVVTGAGPLRAMYRHILPNVSSIVLVIAGFDVGGAILAEAGLSALGLGVQVPTASWGNMLSSSLDYFDRAWWMVVGPGIAIVLAVFCVFILADGLRDALDPRLS
jgi:peptide/nickel transport system permease protein